MTRTEYVDAIRKARKPKDRERAHEEYHGQYVNDQIKQIVLRGIGQGNLLKSTDPHMNDIPLARWDDLVHRIPKSTVDELKANGDYLTLGTGVCILKAAARWIVTNHGSSE